MLFAAKDGDTLYSQQKQDLELADSDHDPHIARFRLKLKKAEKTTGLFRYDLNQIPYYFRVEVTSRFKGLDLIECLKNYGWRLRHCTGGRFPDHLQEKEMQKGKMAV